MHEIAYQLPMHMIADIVGIPPRDREALFTLVQRSLEALNPDRGVSREEMVAAWQDYCLGA